MGIARLPRNEAARLNALYSHDILDTAFEAAFDDIAEVARWLAGATIGLITLIDKDRQWFKAARGLAIREIPRDAAFCAHTILLRQLLVVSDALEDPRFADNPLVIGPPNIRSYAGVPLTTPDRHNLGTLCVFDDHPRAFSAGEQLALGALGRLTAAALELRRRVAMIRRHAEETAGQDATSRLASELLVKPILHFWEHMSVLPKQFGLQTRTHITANQPALALVLEEIDQQTSHIRKISEIVSRIADELQRGGRAPHEEMFSREAFPVAQWSSSARLQVSLSLLQEEETRSAEAENLAGLSVYQAFEEAPDHEFDMASGLAFMLFDTPMSALLLVDGERRWFMGTDELDAEQAACAGKFCDYVMQDPSVQTGDVVVVNDGRAHPELGAMLAPAHPRTRFYAGTRFLNSSGDLVGALCVMAPHARKHFSKNAQSQLKVLARLVSGQLELRQVLQRERQQRDRENRERLERELLERQRQIQEQEERKKNRPAINIHADIMELIANVATGEVPNNEVLAMALMAWGAHKESRVLLITCLKFLRRTVHPAEYRQFLKKLDGFTFETEAGLNI
jgi:GAF domain-containing protein